jgi:hypothetical protein
VQRVRRIGRPDADSVAGRELIASMSTLVRELRHLTKRIGVYHCHVRADVESCSSALPCAALSFRRFA